MGRSHDPRVPAWARLLNAARFARFTAAVEAALDGRAFGGSVRSGIVEVDTDDGARLQIGLASLLQTCHAAPPDDWPELAAAHVAGLLGPRRADDHAVETALVADFGRARAALRVRLWPREFLDSVGPTRMVWREDLPGVVTGLALDLPWSIRALRPAEVAAWGVPVDELFGLALDNIARSCPPQVEHVARDDLPDVVFLTSTERDCFAASHALLLARHPGTVGRHGALVGIPHRHMVVVHPIEDLRVVDAVRRLVPFVRRACEAGPGSVDEDLFWFRAGEFVRLPCAQDADGSLRFAPPAAFERLVGRLREER